MSTSSPQESSSVDLKRYPTFEEWAKTYGDLKSLCPEVGVDDVEAAWHARDAQVNELLEALRVIDSEIYPVGGQPTRRQLSKIKIIAQDAIAKSTSSLT